MKEDKWKKLWDNLKPHITSFAQKAGETISEIAKTLGKESLKLAKIGKLKAEILVLEGNRSEFFRKIGELLYDSYKKGEDFTKEKFIDLIQKVEEIEGEILKKQKEIENIAKEENLEPEDIERIPPIKDEEEKN